MLHNALCVPYACVHVCPIVHKNVFDACTTELFRFAGLTLLRQSCYASSRMAGMMHHAINVESAFDVRTCEIARRCLSKL